jgi:hypothetical protein
MQQAAGIRGFLNIENERLEDIMSIKAESDMLANRHQPLLA